MDMDRDPVVHNRTVNVSEAPPQGRSSNSLAYLIGGLVIALGLMAFLFYDGNDRAGTDAATTGSVTQSERTPANPGMTGGTSRSPATGATTTTNPAGRPTNPQ